MRGHRPVDAGFVGKAFEDALNSAGVMPMVSWIAKCPSMSGRIRSVRGMIRKTIDGSVFIFLNNLLKLCFRNPKIHNSSFL